jgi:uncharacterized membrane protein
MTTIVDNVRSLVVWESHDWMPETVTLAPAPCRPRRSVQTRAMQAAEGPRDAVPRVTHPAQTARPTAHSGLGDMGAVYTRDPELVVASWGRRVSLLMVIPLLISTVIGLVLLWPMGSQPELPGDGVRYRATLESVFPCPAVNGVTSPNCLMGRMRLEEGPEAGKTVEIPVPAGPGSPTVRPGDPAVLAYNSVAFDPAAPADSRYEFVDLQRSRPLVLLGVLFGVAVIAMSRWRGVAALAGLAASVVLIIVFVLPALLEGSPPLAVAVVGASAIMITTLYLTHGPSVRTTVALVGTLLSLCVTGVLGAVFTAVGRFTGLADESAAYLGTFTTSVDMRGLLLAGLVIGALGVLDDVTITQTAAVWEVTAANPTAPRRRVFAAGMRIGRDHVASTVNTLVLAYAGAALPLLLLLQVSSIRLGDVLSSEIIAQEIVRSLVGGLGIVAAVPITTALAAVVAAGHHPETNSPHENRNLRTKQHQRARHSRRPTVTTERQAAGRR